MTDARSPTPNTVRLKRITLHHGRLAAWYYSATDQWVLSIDGEECHLKFDDVVRLHRWLEYCWSDTGGENACD